MVPQRPAEYDDEPVHGAHRDGASNFTRQLASPDSDLAQQVAAKDPYAFEFLGFSGEVAERDLGQALMGRIAETLREIGPGCAFVGRQVHFEVDGDDFYIDLLFFPIQLPQPPLDNGGCPAKGYPPCFVLELWHSPAM